MDHSARKITVTLDRLVCHQEEQSHGSNPYLWPATVFVNKSTLQVNAISIPESSAHKILKAGMKPGDSVAIDANAGSMERYMSEPSASMAIIVTAGIFEDNETPEDAVRAGFRAYKSALETSIKSHLFALASTNPADVEQARAEIASEVEDAVRAAVRGALSTTEKIKVKLGILTPDSSMGSGSTSFEQIRSQGFTLMVGDPMKHSYEIDGRLDVRIQLCYDQMIAYNQATVALSSAKDQLRRLQTEFAQASPAERQVLRLEIDEARENVQAMEAQVDTAKAALDHCRDRFTHLHDVEPTGDVLVTG